MTCPCAWVVDSHPLPSQSSLPSSSDHWHETAVLTLPLTLPLQLSVPIDLLPCLHQLLSPASCSLPVGA